MMRTVLASLKLFEELLQADREIAERVRVEPCPHCGGRLHVADYPRKPRGVPSGLSAWWRRRFSFCCGREGCRRRQTPPSVRFLGRRVYSAVWIVFAGLLASASRPSSTSTWSRARDRLGVSRRTWQRWLDWWRLEYPRGRASRELRAKVIDHGAPLVVYRHLSGTPPDRLRPLLFLVQAIPIGPGVG